MTGLTCEDVGCRCADPSKISRLDELMSRCARCRWPLAKSADQGCVPGNCSMRPLPALDDIGVLREEVHRLKGLVGAVRSFFATRDSCHGLLCILCQKCRSQADKMHDALQGADRE